MPGSAREVFDVLHDYERRLEWDPVMREARLTGGRSLAGPGATRHSRTSLQLGSLELDEQYVTFHPGELASLKMVNHPPLLDSFGTCTRHKDTPQGSVAIYSANFHTRPKWLRPVMEPLAAALLMFEAKRHLRSLAEEVKRRKPPPSDAVPVTPEEPQVAPSFAGPDYYPG
jgi:hypothetical protein